MSEQGPQEREWPPVKRADETGDDFLERIKNEAVIEHAEWLDKLTANDPNALLEVADSVISEQEVEVLLGDEDDYMDESQLSPEDAKHIVTTLTAMNDQRMAAVKAGDPKAVEEFAQDELFTLKFNTLHEK